jgi:hypothetical protein
MMFGPTLGGEIRWAQGVRYCEAALEEATDPFDQNFGVVSAYIFRDRLLSSSEKIIMKLDRASRPPSL